MANRYYTFAEHEYYHIYNRGNSKQVILKSESDFDRFKKLLYIANSPERFVLREFGDVDVFAIDRKETLVHIGAYCLMSNHFHILLTPAVPNGVAQFMLKLGTGYSSYFNKKYSRTGGLFEGSYKAKHVDTDRYLKYLFSYIHLNPYRNKEGVVEKKFNLSKLNEYRHSSLLDYLAETRGVGKILAPSMFPKYFENIGEHKRELFEWLDFQEF